MKKSIFEYFFSNLYSTARIIDSRLYLFATYLLAAMKNKNTDNAFNDNIATLSAAITAFFGSQQTKLLATTSRKVSTYTLSQAVKNFADGVRAKHAAISAVYPEKTATYIEFFPNKLTEFSRLTHGNVLGIAKRFASVADKYKDQLGKQPFADLFANYLKDITDAMEAQNDKKSAVDHSIASTDITREPVETALMKSMFAIGSKHWPDSKTCMGYFDFSLLFADKHAKGATTNGKVAAKSVALASDGGFDRDSIFVLKNLSDLPFTFYMAHDKGGPQVGTELQVAPHTVHMAPFAEFAAKDGLFLYVKNDTAFEGDWEVRVE